MIAEYRAAVEPLLKYLPWMEKNGGRTVSRNYQGNGLSKSSISFPVYDANLVPHCCSLSAAQPSKVPPCPST